MMETDIQPNTRELRRDYIIGEAIKALATPNHSFIQKEAAAVLAESGMTDNYCSIADMAVSGLELMRYAAERYDNKVSPVLANLIGYSFTPSASAVPMQYAMRQMTKFHADQSVMENFDGICARVGKPVFESCQTVHKMLIQSDEARMNYVSAVVSEAMDQMRQD